MNKFEKTFWVFVTLAEVAIVAFWVAGMKGNLEFASTAFIFAGSCCVIALGALGMKKLRGDY